MITNSGVYIALTAGVVLCLLAVLGLLWAMYQDQQR